MKRNNIPDSAFRFPRPEFRFTVPDSIQNTRLYPLTRRMLPELPEYAIREAFEKRDVKVNGIRVGKNDEALPGAEVQIYTRHGQEAKQIEVLYEDDNLLVVRKPAGVSCEADGKGGKTITEWVGEGLRTKALTVHTPLLCHRLDNQTDGLLLLAKNEQVRSALVAAFQNHQIHKVYTCLVRGTPRERHGWLSAYLLKDAAKSRVRIVERPERGALKIVTEYEVMEPGFVSRLRVTLHTGRMHQIRAQMAAIGHPVLGDDVYGDRAFNKTQKTRRLMLCATELMFSMEGELAYMNGTHLRVEPNF